MEEEKRLIRVGEATLPAGGQQPPRSQGLLFLLIINLSAVLLVAAVIFGSFLMFRERRQRLDTELREYVSAEGKILDEFKREAEERLKEKDAAILRVLRQLSALDTEREQLSRIVELRLQEKEQEMRAALDGELAAERQRLLLSETPTGDLERLLLAYETERKRSIFEGIKSYQQEIDALTRVKEQELLEEIERARLSLEEATRERERLLQETQKSEIALRGRLQVQPLGNASDPLAGVLAQQQALRGSEQLVNDQITGAYLLIGNALNSGRYRDATREIGVLKILLQEESFAAFPTIRYRRAADLRIIAALEEHIAGATGEAAAEAEQLRRQLGDREAELAALRIELRERSAETDRAYEDALALISRYAAAASRRSREQLRQEVGERSLREPVVQRLYQAIQNLAEQSGASFRILGTVTLTGPDSVTILPIVNLPVETGAQVEIRRIMADGETVPVASGTITEVKPGRMVAQIVELLGENRPSVTDKVFLRME